MPERVLPREFNPPPEFLLPLSNIELQELGTFTAIWSQIDWIILLMVSHLTKTELSHLQLFMETMTTGPRVGLLTKLCRQNPGDITNAIKKTCDDNSGLIEDRNHVIHGLWAIHWNRKTGATTPSCLFQKNKREPIDAGKLTILSERAAALSNRLGELLAQMYPELASERPRPFFFGDGSPPADQPPPPWPPIPPTKPA